MTTMIALVGEQPQPNFLPVIHYKPANVVFVYTGTTREKYNYLTIALEKKKFSVSGIETDPYNLRAIVTALNDRLANMAALSSQSLVFNLTGGTKPMVLAASQVAAQYSAPVFYLQSEKGASIIDHYSWQDYQLCYQQQELITTDLGLQDVLELQLGPQKDPAGKDIWKVNGPLIRADEGHLFELAIARALHDHGYEEACGVKGKN
ncbi:MAG: DUF1887 family protein, partial [Chloroflexi bacterium]|nr:DUF1887 family protein [Chloroflexota bacterium]